MYFSDDVQYYGNFIKGTVADMKTEQDRAKRQPCYRLLWPPANHLQDDATIEDRLYFVVILAIILVVVLLEPVVNLLFSPVPAVLTIYCI